MRLLRILAVLFLLSSSAPGRTQAIPIQSLEIESAWGGLGPSDHANLLIKRDGEVYRSAEGTVRPELMAAFARAIAEPMIGHPLAANLGIDDGWLRQHVEAAGAGAWNVNYVDGLPEQKGLFRKAFLDLSTLDTRLARVYQRFHTDDYPHIQVTAVWQDGSEVTWSTDSQNEYMLPWCSTVDGKTVKTYNADIARAVYALLPLNFANRERLTERGLDRVLGDETASPLQGQWNLMKAQRSSADALTTLKTAYEMRSADVNSYHSLAFGKSWDGNHPHEENLHADLWQSGFPKGLVVTAILLREGGITQGASSLIEQAPAYTKLVFSVPWLDAFLRNHPEEHAWLFYVHGESLTDKAMKIFAADMKSFGRTDLVERVRVVQHQAALLETGAGEYWIILPDKTAILWRWASTSHVLKWPGVPFPRHDCTEYRIVTGGCAGVTISADGVAETDR